MAVLLALRKMLLYMRKSKVDFIVLDDAISDLDESGTQSIVDLADVLSKEVGHVFVTLPQHVPTIKQDSIVRVSKKDGVSCVS
jgi:ABC-type antimicrobial peptide transport system ATPase subunit